MKKTMLLLLLVFIVGVSANAQQGYRAVYMAGGLTHEKGTDLLIGLDFPSNSYHSFEIIGQYFNTKQEKNILGGLGYKYCFNKSLNSMFRGKIAGMVGTTTHTTIFAPVGGFEYIYAISPLVDIMGLVDGGYYFNSTQSWRVNLFIGLRLNF